MIDSVGSFGNYRQPPPSSNSNNVLSNDQKSVIEDTLSNYDANNLSQQDATSLVEAFSEAGISPGVAFADMLAESGFDARAIGELASVGESGPAGGQRPPPPPGGRQSESGLDLSSVMDFLDELAEEDETSSASSTSMAAQLAEKFGLPEGQSLINVTA